MKIGDKVYYTGGDKVTPGVIVAKRWAFSLIPMPVYVVKKLPAQEASIVSVITTAFYGSPDDLVCTAGAYLVPMPAAEPEAQQ
jgi:hypothetical protein